MQRKTKAQLIEELKGFEQRMAMLSNLEHVLADATTVLQLFEITYEKLSDCLDTDSFYLGVYHEAEAIWENLLHFEHGVRVKPHRRHLGFGFTKHILTTAESLFISTEEEYHQFCKTAGVALVGELPKSWMGVPLLVDDQVLGIMAIQDYAVVKAYSRQDLAFFSTCAAILAHALQTLLAFEQAQAAQTQNPVFYQLGLGLLSPDDLPDLMQRAVNHLAQLLSADTALLLFVDHDRQAVEQVCVSGGLIDVSQLTYADLQVGLYGWVFQEHQSALVLDGQPDAREAPLVQAHYETAGVGSMALVPVLLKGAVLGFIQVVNAVGAQDFTSQDLELLTSMANQLSMVIQSARLLDTQEKKVSEMSLLNEIGQALSEAMTMEQVLETIYKQVGRRFDTRNFYIATYESPATEWVLAFNIKDGERQSSQSYPLDHGLTGCIISQRHPIFFSKGDEYLAFLKAQGIEAVGESPESWMGVPLIAFNQVVGVMGIESYERNALYNDQDLTFFYAMAAQVSNAIQNARLFEQFQTRADREHRVRTITDRIRRATDIESILRVAVEELTQVLGASVGVARLGTREQLLAKTKDETALSSSVKRGNL